MKGFKSRISKENSYIWVCRKDGNIFETNSKNIGKETNFYGEAGPNTLDDHITYYENTISSKLDLLRENTCSSEIDDISIADFVAHIATRTKHLREAVADSFESIGGSLIKYFNTTDNFVRVAKKMIVRQPPAIVNELDQQLAARGLSRKQRREFLIAYIENNIEQLHPLINEAQKLFELQIRSAIASGHLQALRKRIIPNWQDQSYWADLKWNLRYYEQSYFILGDLGILMRCRSPKVEYRILPDKNKTLDAVVLPISPRHLIIGSPAGKSNVEIEPEELNIASARNSKDFFIGADKCLVEKYRGFIGKDNPLITETEARLLFKEIVKNLY